MTCNKHQSNFVEVDDSTIVSDGITRPITWRECQFCQVDDTITSILRQGRQLLVQSADSCNEDEAVDDGVKRGSVCGNDRWKTAIVCVIAISVLLSQVVIILTITYI